MATAAQMMQARAARNQRFHGRLEWFGQQLERGLRMGMMQRMRFVTQLTRDKVVINISVPVVKELTADSEGRMRTTVTERSKPGEFPRADTTRLMKDIFKHVRETTRGAHGIVGTTLDYGLYLETSPRLRRAFLVPTLDEMRPHIVRILTARTPRLPGDNHPDTRR